MHFPDHASDEGNEQDFLGWLVRLKQLPLTPRPDGSSTPLGLLARRTQVGCSSSATTVRPLMTTHSDILSVPTLQTSGINSGPCQYSPIQLPGQFVLAFPSPRGVSPRRGFKLPLVSI